MSVGESGRDSQGGVRASASYRSGQLEPVLWGLSRVAKHTTCIIYFHMWGYILTHSLAGKLPKIHT